MKQRINWIWKKDLDSYFKAAKTVSSKEGDYVVVPDDLEIYKVPTKEEQLKIEIQRLEKELEGMKEPSERELVEFGKSMHPYFGDLERLEILKDELKTL